MCFETNVWAKHCQRSDPDHDGNYARRVFERDYAVEEKSKF